MLLTARGVRSGAREIVGAPQALQGGWSKSARARTRPQEYGRAVIISGEWLLRRDANGSSSDEQAREENTQAEGESELGHDQTGQRDADEIWPRKRCACEFNQIGVIGDRP